jgi:hypothetical protein
LLQQYKERLQLALYVYCSSQFSSYKATAAALKVNYRPLFKRVKGILSWFESPANSHKLIPTGEQIIVQHILDLNLQRFASQLYKGVDMCHGGELLCLLSKLAGY